MRPFPKIVLLHPKKFTNILYSFGSLITIEGRDSLSDDLTSFSTKVCFIFCSILFGIQKEEEKDTIYWSLCKNAIDNTHNFVSLLFQHKNTSNFQFSVSLVTLEMQHFRGKRNKNLIFKELWHFLLHLRPCMKSWNKGVCYGSS